MNMPTDIEDKLISEWLRPSDFRKTHGLSRSYIYELIAQGIVKTVTLNQPGKKTGVRLVEVASVRKHIESHLNK